MHCQRYINEQKVNLQPQQQQQASNIKSNDSTATNVDAVPLDSTALIATKGETGQTVYTSKPCVLFCDLKLYPGEIRTCTYAYLYMLFVIETNERCFSINFSFLSGDNIDTRTTDIPWKLC